MTRSNTPKTFIHFCVYFIIIFAAVMRRRRKRKQKKINIKPNTLIGRTCQRDYCKDYEEFADTKENQSKINVIDQICQNNNRPINIHSEDVTTQTEDVKEQRGVSKNRNDIGFQFPEVVINPQQQSKIGKSSKKRPRQHLVVHKNHAQIRHLCYIRRSGNCYIRSHSYKSALRTCRPLSTQSGSFVRSIEGVSRILVRLRNSSIAISKAFLDGFIAIGKLLEIWLELTFKARNKLSCTAEENVITKNGGDLLIFEQKLDSISKDIANLKNIILGECTQIYQRIDGVEAKQNHFESILQKTNVCQTTCQNSAKNAAPNPFVPPPPPPLPPSTTIEYNATSNNTPHTVGTNAKRSISNINVCNNINERIAITVEDLRNVKLRPRSRKDSNVSGIMQNQQPFISPQMLNGVKLRRTSREQTNVIVTGVDGDVSDASTMARQQCVRLSGKFNTL